MLTGAISIASCLFQAGQAPESGLASVHFGEGRSQIHRLTYRVSAEVGFLLRPKTAVDRVTKNDT